MRYRLFFLHFYNDLRSLEDVDNLTMNEFRLRAVAMHDLMAMQQGVDPDAAPRDDKGRKPSKPVSAEEMEAFKERYRARKEKEKQMNGNGK